MATALIPLIAGVAPDIIKLITALTHKHAPLAEATHGPQTGPVKFADVFTSVIQDLQKAASTGQIDKTLPPDEEIKLIIQSVVTSLKLNGLLDNGGDDNSIVTTKTNSSTTSKQSIKISPGQSIIITAS